MDLRRRTVLDANGQEVGRVTALIIDTTVHHVRFLQVSFGGFLGMGRKTTFIPVDLIAHTSPTTVTIDRSGQMISSGPTYDPEFIDDIALFEKVWNYYQVPPHLPKPSNSSRTNNPGKDDY